MQRLKRISGLLILALLWAGMAYAQTGYALMGGSFHSVGQLTGGTHTLASVVGQPTVSQASGGQYILRGGAVGPNVAPEPTMSRIYLPFVER